MNKLTGSLEDYLEVIYVLQEKNGCVRITDIASELSISKPSVNRAVKTLKSQNLLTHERYGTITLTDLGKSIAKDVDFRHKAITRFFVESLHIDPKIAEEDACKIEHIISPQTLQKLVDYSSKI